MISSLELAASYLQADPDRDTALVVSADNHGTPLVDRWRMTPGALIGDAAAALVLGKDYGMAELLAVNATVIPEADAVNDGAYPLFPPDATVGRGLSFGDRHEEFRQKLLKAQGTGIHLTIQKTMMEQVERTLDEAGIGLDDVTRVASSSPIPASSRVRSTCSIMVFWIVRWMPVPWALSSFWRNSSCRSPKLRPLPTVASGGNSG